MGEALGLECWCWRQRAWNLPVSGFRPEASLLLCSLERWAVGVARVVSGRTQKMKGQELWVSFQPQQGQSRAPRSPSVPGELAPGPPAFLPEPSSGLVYRLAVSVHRPKSRLSFVCGLCSCF